MKTIEAVSIWDNGQVKQAKILNACAVNITLGVSANFWYQLLTENDDQTMGVNLASGNLLMTGEAYAQWEVDSYAWDWIAGQLNLTITGEYVTPLPPEPTPIVEEEVVVEEPIV